MYVYVSERENMLFSGLNFWSSVVTLRNVERERERERESAAV